MRSVPFSLIQFTATTCGTIALLIVIEIVISSPAAAEGPLNKHSCTNSPIYAEDDYIREASALGKQLIENMSKPLFKQVPKGLLIINEQTKYEVPRYATIYIVPRFSGPVSFGMRNPYEFTSPCRVQDAQGQEWIVYREKNGMLGYVWPALVEAVTSHH